jgi:hypothetical protein
MAVLFLSELHYYFRLEVTDQLFVNTTMATTIRASFDISFPDIPCAGLTIDAVDDAGTSQSHAVHEFFKHRLDTAGGKQGMPERHYLGDAMKSEGDLNDLTK